MSSLILTFLKSGKISGKDFAVAQDKQDKLEQDLADLLQQANALGTQYGQAMVKHQESLAAKMAALAYFLKRAKKVVVGLVQRVRDVVSDILSGGGSQEDVQEAVDNLLDHLPDTIATTEVHSEVEDAVLETLKSNGVEQVEWICEPGACETCLDNEDAGPIDITDAFPSGDQNPPAHPNCRCVTMIPLKDEDV